MVKNGANDDDAISIISYSPQAALEESEFPVSNVHLDAANVISIVCGNSRYHWALHGGYHEDYFPTLFWKTTIVTEVDEEEASNNIQAYFPEKAFQALGGPDFSGELTVENLLAHITKRRIPYLHVYMISSGETSKSTVAALFSRLPCRIVELKAGDFVKGQYEGVGVDRCANVRAAQQHYGNPCLVIDGGTAMTWTGSKVDGSFRGGGIAPGIGMKMRAMNEDTGKLPYIDQNVMKEAFKACRDSKQPLNNFANNTQEAMIVGVCREIALSIGDLVKGFHKYASEHFKNNPPAEEEKGEDAAHEIKKNDMIRVVVTGGDGPMIEELLGENHACIIEETEKSDTEAKVVISQHKNLSSHAIGLILKENQMVQNDMAQLEKIRNDILGSRICKAGSRRGTVCQVKRSTTNSSIAFDRFRIKYDDGSGEVVGPDELNEYLVEFARVGEDPTFPQPDDEGRKTHVEHAKKAAALLVDNVASLKNKPDATNKRGAQGEPGPDKKRARMSDEEVKNMVLGKKKSKSAFPTISVAAITANPRSYIGRRVAKHFSSDLYYGEVCGYDASTSYWQIEYDDGDKEEYDAREMETQLKEYQLHPDNENT